MVTAAEVFGMVGGAAGGLTAVLVVVDRVFGRHRRDVLTSRDLADFKTKLGEAVEANRVAAASAQESLLDRVKLTMRVDNLEAEAKKFDETRDAVIRLEATNKAEHEESQRSMAQIQRGLEGVQSQVRLYMTGGANRSMEIRDSNREGGA